MSITNVKDCWKKVCPSCNCDGEWLKAATMWIEFMEPGGEHGKLYHYFLYRLNGDEQSASDCLQETLVRFFMSVERGTFDYRRKVMPYLWRIALNVINDFLRNTFYSMQVESLEEIDEEKSDWAGGQHSEDEVDTGLLDALDHMARRAHLSEFQRQVIRLCQIQQLKPREAANLLQVPARKVSNELFRARKKIKEALLDNAAGKINHLPLGE